uniref:Putative transcription factor datf1 n=1 Tax=Lutzomyia longipalpis TaxID=7200 RepID=A0A1B0GHB7_LUTLO
MSNSVFTDFSAQSRNDSSLVIVRNKDGVVSVDSAALRSYLKNESGNTSVSVIRVASPTPSLKEELEEEEQELHANPDNDDMDGDLTRKDVDPEAPHVRVTVEDFYSPDEAKRLRSEILQYAGMSSHLLLDIDNEERVKSIHNDHCYTPLTSPSQRNPPSRATTPPTVQPPAKEVRKAAESEPVDAGKAEESDQEGGQSDAATESTFSESDFSVSESENDRDSDLDYTVNDRGTRRGKNKKNRGGAKGASARGRVTRKQRQSFSFEVDPAEGFEEEEPRSESGGKKKPKAPKTPKPTPIKVQKKREELPKEESPKAEVVQQPKVQPQLVVKKDKKPPAHVEALFTDMTSLFSTPDIIKKVSSEAAAKVEPPPLVYTTKTYGPKKEIALETDRDQLELIDSIVKQELEARAPIDSTTQQMAEDIPSIVKMLENPDTALNPELLSDVIGLNTSQVATSTAATPAQAANTAELDLLEGLTSEDGLPDELLQHVAELVENKNLQEVIDKQVLGVQTTLGTAVTTTPPVSSSTPKMEEKESPFVKLAKQKQMAKEAAASIMSMNRKEPITIVRSDGRVITLPPIEAPTTRGAKRRAQSTASTPNTSVASSPTSTPQHKAQRDADVVPSLKRSTSKGTDKEASKSSSRRTSATPSLAESEENMDSDASWNSEDDPDRLWCICKQPHNNRFMICCDACEDWFHGKCVNITKAMGQQMEEQGIEWRCPNCLKKGPAAKKGGSSASDDASSAQSPTSSSTSTLLSCIVCKKPSRPNSIYCSDDCIRKHAMVTTKSSGAAKEAPSKPPAAPGGATKKVGVLKNKFDRVIVYNKVTGKCLSGESAPTLTNLKHWLSENPNYEVVQPGSAIGQAFKAKQAQLTSISKQMALKRQQQMEKESAQGKEKVQTQLKVMSNKQIVVMHPSGQKLTAEGKSSPKVPKASPQASTSGGQKVSLKQTQLPVTKTKKSPAAADGAKSSPRGEPEPIRVNVRRTLKEQLTSRIADTTEVQGKLTAEEVAKFATDVEYEMFMLFNKDTGTKYRAKYRSLMFNIKDRKNMSLLEKICEKFITPGQLVRMAPEELASQELAQWRENENKHQLEMIKKSELDLLACAKNYVLKTHKGEEVIEGRISERVSLDPSIAVEDVVSVLNNSTVTSSSEPEGAKEKGKSEKGGKDAAVSSSKSGGHSSSSKKKDRDRRSRSRDRHDSRGKSSKHKRKRSRERRSRSRDKEERHREAKREKDREKGGRDRDRSRDKKSVSSSTKKVSEDKKVPQKEVKPAGSEKKQEESYNLIDKILKASEIIDKTTTAVDEGKKEAKEVKELVAKGDKVSESQIPEPPKKSMSVESDQEPSSTITIPTPPETTYDNEEEEQQEYTAPPSIWTGSINMVDVATFQISAFSVSGECEAIGKELPPALDIVGRISPETVWEYISKIKKSGNKEILILQFKAETESEQTKYFALYTYLDSRKRLGVVKTASTSIKDFYISPLAAHKSLPSVLLPIKGVGFEDNRPDLLLGILVMIKSGGLQDSRKKLMMMMPKQGSKEKIPAKVATVAAPSKVESNPDDDEPYSPGGSDDDIPMLPSSTSTVAPAAIAALDPDDIQRKMEELNRQIGAKKMEIAGILNKGQDTISDEPYSPSGPVTPPAIPAIPAAIPSLANISIPSNLSEILASIKNVSGPTTAGSGGTKGIDSIDPAEEEEDEEYTPIAPSSISGTFQGVDYKPTGYKPTLAAAATTTDSSGPSKLAQLSEEELLSMVPDDAILEDIKASKADEAAATEAPKDDPTYEPAAKKSKWDEKEKSTEPPPPGLEDEYEPE